MQALPFNEKERSELQKEVIRYCWSTDRKSRRHKISKKRIEAPISSGGLGISGIDTINEAHIANMTLLQLHESCEGELGYSLGKQIRNVLL